ncbi:MAG: hypothetical protein PHE88_03550 [Elusimicrobia bacterium]|nr:hypothetical protein [Elusimicrobiota bacterium]
MGRIYTDQRWFSDVVGGALLGTLSAKLVISCYNSVKSSNHKLDVYWLGNGIRVGTAF